MSLSVEYPALATIQPDGHVPETRMDSAAQVQDYVNRLLDNDAIRARKRAKVSGLVDGNPPFNSMKLREAGRGDACNVNWGTGRSYLESGSGAIYDLATEAPGMVQIRTDFGEDRKQKEYWSRVMSQEADRILGANCYWEDGKIKFLGGNWDYEEQQSNWNMILMGCGPLFFEDNYCVLPRSRSCGDLLVPERTPSDTHWWDAAALCIDYYPPQLYKFIMDHESATKRGWDVEYTMRVIANAMDVRQPNNKKYDYEFVQAEMKNNSLAYYDDAKVNKLAFVYWKEFDGTITTAIVERDSTTGTPTGAPVNQNEPERGGVKYLYFHQGEYDSWSQCIHPMYYDRGNGGWHHSVTGLGVKMLSPFTYENRLICDLMDKTSAPKILFKPTSGEMTQKFQMMRIGDYGVLPANCEAIQNPIQGMLSDGIAMQGLASNLNRQNLSAYRQPVEPQKSGNPATKFEKQVEVSQQSSLSKTTFNRYYQQRDQLFCEIVRRLTIKNSPDERAKLFQKCCKERGLPDEAFKKITAVAAVRVIGQGSAFARREAVNALLPLAGSLPEEGRQNLISDKIATEAGQANVDRYNPDRERNDLASDQEERATLWVCAFRNGVDFKVTDTQNALTFAGIFLNAAAQSLNSVKQGADLATVVSFLDKVGPAIAACLKRIHNDPLRKSMFKPLFQQFQQIHKMTDQLKKQLQKQQQAQAQQRQRQQQAMSDQALKAQKAKSDIQIKQAKTRAQLQQSAEKHRMAMAQDAQDLQINDAKAASEIHINRLKMFADQQNDGESSNGE